MTSSRPQSSRYKYFQFSWLGKITFGLLASLWCLGAYWLLWPYEPIVIEKIEILNKDRIAYAGEDLEYAVTYTKKERYKVIKVTRQLISPDATIIMKVGDRGVRLPLGHHTVPVYAPIPDYCFPGKFDFLLTAMYEVNPIRIITVEYRTKPLTVRKR
jgi:hypothetical protein